MKAPTRAGKRSGALISGVVMGFVGVGLCATPVSAHTPTWQVTCSEVTIDLTAYNDNVINTVTVTVDGKDLLPTEEFGREFHKTLKLPEHKIAVPVHLVVKAGDDERYSRDEIRTSPVCEVTSPPPTKPTPSDTPSTEPPKPETPAPSTSAPAPHLAETGGSSTTPLIAGAAVAAVLAGGGILVAIRKRRPATRG
ncbi:LPXTG cell wall anchor domain-containing protein (plasmid) [Streptomyces sp. NBC_01717]|uniref:LAETG motif-containing sortase-dependent surface protein n=1 Tax=Streptomyces sp. NBC_01717 TaxID=2975918 RepID=UPI002E37E3AF|nr:LAETG motif-containing sortase-dependent surface protein [Streptomyces sp. NBC_01717]